MTGEAKTSARWLGEIVGIALMSYAASRLAVFFLIEPEGMAPFWFANGVVLAFLLRRSPRLWAYYLAASFAGFFANMTLQGFPLVPNGLYGVANVAEPLVAAALVKRFVPRFQLRNLKAFVVLLFSSVIASLVGASLAWLAGPIRWSLWLIDDLLGLLLVAPTILVFWNGTDGPAEHRPRSRWQIVEMAAIASGLFAVTWALFNRSVNVQILHYYYFILPFLLWASIRYKDKGAVISSLFLAGLTIGLTVNGIGPFATAAPLQADRSLGIQLFLAVFMLSNLGLGIMLRERRHLAEINLAQIKALERIAADEPLVGSLDFMVRQIEAQIPGASGSILLFDAKDGCLRHGSAPNLPKALNDAVDGVKVGPTVGSCGTAAYRGERVAVADIATHPYWTDYKHLALPYGLRACWSSPIFSPAREVLGTFAIYYKEPRLPEEEEIGWVDAATSLAAIAIARDRSRVLEAQVTQAQRMESLGTLAGGIAHDFNNILTAISGNVGLIQKALEPEHPARRRLAIIQDACARAAELVRQILTFSREQVGERMPMKLGPLVEETTRLLKATIPRAIELRTQSCSNDLEVVADSSQIHQVVMNLATNALHALSEKGGVLEISLEQVTLDVPLTGVSSQAPAGRNMCLRVRDTGVGMDSPTLARIFDPFYTTKPTGQGTGLGLSVVLGIVRSHGGTLTVTSEIARGTTFEVFLPSAAPH